MALYKLTKGTVSVIRNSKAAVDEAIANGYKLDGECNERYEIIDADPFKEPEPEHKHKKYSSPAKGESDGD